MGVTSDASESMHFTLDDEGYSINAPPLIYDITDSPGLYKIRSVHYNTI